MASSKELIPAIARIRRSACAILRIRPKAVAPNVSTTAPPGFELGFVGSGACIARDRYILTAFHIFNNAQPRDPRDKFVVFTLTDDNLLAFHCPVIGVPLEHAAHDLAILELGKPVDPRFSLEPLAVSLDLVPEGTEVITYGFPAPVVKGANLSPTGDFLGGGNFFLKGHANTGIVSAQYDLHGAMNYAFNVDWVHGESGGIVCDLANTRLFTIMQSYRTIATPTGVMAGPRMGRGFQGIAVELRELLGTPA
jgi:hypothetical protein